jgi:phosphodiesterase/alkaline phosphatase D-like protein
MQRPFVISAQILVLFLLVFSAIASTESGPIFTHGVASGDASPYSTVLWVRTDQEALVKAEVSASPDFGKLVFKETMLSSAANDFTVKVRAEPLAPDQLYYFRWRHGNRVSETGTFRTSPEPAASAGVRFAFTGDSDGTKVNGAPYYNQFETLDAVRSDNPDFFVYLGDTIYSDSGLRSTGPASTLEDYRQAYRENREVQALRNLLSGTSVFALWDDHEVRNDYQGQTVDPALYANGRQAFFDYMPNEEIQTIQDPACAGAPQFRIVHWGQDVDLIFLDQRSCRSAEVTAACSFSPTVVDLAPTLPAIYRQAFGLPASPPAGCLAAIFDPTRTMLGSVQKQLFKTTLLESQARWKFVINPLPIQQFYALPYDRWEGYGAERNEILNFIRSNGISNVIFLTTDTHATLVNQVFVDRFGDPAPIAQEFVTGPIATNTMEKQILAQYPTMLGAFHAVLNISGVDCRHLNKYSYGLVEVDAATGAASIQIKDDTGAVVVDQLNPSIQCTWTSGP